MFVLPMPATLDDLRHQSFKLVKSISTDQLIWAQVMEYCFNVRHATYGLDVECIHVEQ